MIITEASLMSGQQGWDKIISHTRLPAGYLIRRPAANQGCIHFL